MTVKRLLVVIPIAAAIAAGCSGDGADLSDPAPSTSTIVVADEVVPPSEPASEPSNSAVPSSSSADGVVATSATAVESTASTVPVTTIVDVPETGVPGLDSEDRFCAAWSRFGGSWQVLLVGSTFLEDPQRVAEWEIAASTVVGEAYEELIAAFPDELVDEADLAADGYFGVLDRRTEEARRALADAGATPDDVELLQEAWIDALSTRDPSTPDLSFVVPDGLADLVSSAAADLRGRRVDFHLDPSMSVDVATPSTDAYLETSCPDQGTLSGQEIDPVDAG